MNSDTFEGKWKQIKGDLKAKWGKLTDDDLKVIDGNIEKFVGKVQALYGEAREVVHTHLKALLAKLEDSDAPKSD